MYYVQLSVTLREWDIPYNELERKEKIGVGRFGTVYKWVTGHTIVYIQSI